MRLITNPGTIDIARSDVAVAIYDELDDHTEPVLIFQQGSLARGKIFRQHGKVPDSSVDSRRFPGGMLIDRALFGDERVHISNADQDLCVAVRQLLRNLDL